MLQLRCNDVDATLCVCWVVITIIIDHSLPMTPSNKYVIKFTALILSIRSYIILINIDIINKISNLVKENSNVYSLN